MRRFKAHFGRRSGRRRLGTAFLGVFAALWLVIEPLGLFFPHAFDQGWVGYAVIVGVSVVAASYMARPRESVSRALPPTDVVVSIRVGDVLAQSGNVVVGVNDAFDTQFEDEVISQASVQGQLLQRVFEGDRAHLDQEIAAALAAVPPSVDAEKTFGKRSRYPIGTVAVVRHGQARYFLPVFTTMSKTLPAHVQTSIEDLEIALAKTWHAVNAAGQKEPVHVPIIGSHLARLGLSRTLLTQMIVLSFIAATRRGGPSSLTVWVSSEDREVVDFIVLDEWLRGLCAA